MRDLSLNHPTGSSLLGASPCWMESWAPMVMPSRITPTDDGGEAFQFGKRDKPRQRERKWANRECAVMAARLRWA